MEANKIEKINEILADDNIDDDTRYQKLTEAYTIIHFKPYARDKTLLLKTKNILQILAKDPYCNGPEVTEITGYRRNFVGGIFRELKDGGIRLPKGPKCQARLRAGGYCEKHTKPGKKYCRMHEFKEDVRTIGKKSFEKGVKDYWEEALKLEKEDEQPIASLNDLFYYVKDCFELNDAKNVSIRRIQQWYRNTQYKEHPVWIIKRGYAHLTAKPYRDILEDKTLKEGHVTAREKITKFLKENPGSYWMEVSEATGHDKKTIYDIANEENLKLQKMRGKQIIIDDEVDLSDVILDCIKSKNGITLDKIKKNLNISDRLVSKNLRKIEDKIRIKGNNIYYAN